MHAFQSGIMAGKLNGVMPAATPSGWRIEYTSMPPPALSEKSPLSRWGMPVANSTTSRPRWMSPRASSIVLPCSLDSSAARESMSFSTRSRNRRSTLARRWGFQSAHSGWAAAAAAVASATSSALASDTRRCTSPVFGSYTSPVRPDRPGISLPPM